MADLAQELGISRPAVYSYFASTEAVLEALLGERLGQLWTHLEGLLPASSSGQQPPTGVYAALFQFLIGERESLLLLHSGGGPAFQARRTAFLNALGRRLELQYPNIRRRPYQLVILTQLLDSLAYYAVQQQLQDVGALAETLDSFLRGGVAQLSLDSAALD
jgi:AcrR family transcriptional regulator